MTTRANPPVNRAIASIPEEAWRPIKYPNAIWEEAEPGLGHWVSDAEVAEVPFSAFTSRRKHEHVQCRLVVRRVKRLQPLAGDGTQQGELMATYRHHAFITNSTLGLVEADQRHRDHAIVEQVIAELKDGPLVREVHGQRRLARSRRDRLQHRPRTGRRHARTPPLGHPADPDHQRPRPDRLHRQTPGLAPAP